MAAGTCWRANTRRPGSRRAPPPRSPAQTSGAENRYPTPADGGDPARVLRVVLNLEPDPADVLGYRRAALPAAVGAPHPLEQVLAREHPTRRGGEKGEEIELLAGHRDLGPVDGHRAGALVDDEVTVVDDRRRCRVAPPEHGPHARLELGERERLGDEVVRTVVEQADAVALGGPSGAHDDRDRAAAADLGQNLRGPAALVEVEDDQVGGLAEDGFERRRHAARLGDVVAESDQVVLKRPAGAVVVFGDQDGPRGDMSSAGG